MIKHILLALVATVALVVALTTGRPQAQAPPTPLPATQATQGIKRIPLQKFDVPGTGYETVVAIAEIAPNVTIGKHVHPGPESGYMIEGEATLIVDGQPSREVKVGESYAVPAGVAHDAKTGPKGAKVIVTYVVEKGKPLATPAK